MKTRSLRFISIFVFFLVSSAYSAINIIRENQTILAVSSFEAAYQHRTQAEFNSRAESRAQLLCGLDRKLESYSLREIKQSGNSYHINAEYITDDGQIRNQDFPFYRPYIYVKGEPEKRERILEEANFRMKVGAAVVYCIAVDTIVQNFVPWLEASPMPARMPMITSAAIAMFKGINYPSLFIGCHLATYGLKGLWMAVNHYSEEEVPEPEFYRFPTLDPSGVFFMKENKQTEFESHWAFKEVNCD